MPITKVYAFRVDCDECGKHGGKWYDRTGPDQCVPWGWVVIEMGDIGGEARVYCLDCAEKKGFAREDHQAGES